ncbi:unnamed protein product, partial [Meganyctiphanes norvegica]
MSTEGLMDLPGPRPLPPSPPISIKPPTSPPTSSASLASHLLAAVSQVQSLTSQLPPSVPLPTSSPSGPPGLGGHPRPHFMGGGMPPLSQGYDCPPMSSILAGLKDFPRQYHSPSPVPSTESHECKIVDYRGAKVASFIINNDTMLCLPQAFELFLKHLVGGLHTVYTKLKRLGIEPIVCNVDQVRILRGLGAIQPGVNRCKLLSMKHFDVLYKDCTTASSRPGRPPKRASDFMTMAPSPEALFDLKKRHLENGGFPHNGHLPGDPHGPHKSPFPNGYPGAPFNPLQYMAHHMAGLGYPPLLPGNLPPGLQGGHGGIPHPISPTEASPLKHPQITPETLARLHEDRVEREQRMLAMDRMDQHRVFTPTSGSGPIPPPFYPRPPHLDDLPRPASPVLNLSKSGSDDGHLDEREDREDRERGLSINDSRDDLRDSSPRRHPDDNRDDDRLSDMDDDEDKDESMDTADAWSRVSNTLGQTQLNSPPGMPGGPPGVGGTAPLSSTEVLLRNILGLLRVAEENARHHERQTQYEKAELKMEVLRERELRETLEKQLQEEQRNRVLMQKRCAKLKKLRRRLQERLELEVKRRTRYEDHLRSASPEVLSDINDSLRKEMEAIAVEIQKENSTLQKDNAADVDRGPNQAGDCLLASPTLATHPAITTATANWRHK